MYIVKLKKTKERKVLNGYPWIYANEVESITGKDVKGAICKVYGNDGKFLCQGFINHMSKILVRVLTKTESEIDYDFFYQRIKESFDRRFTLGYDNNFRAVFGESDLLPGLIVDKYGDYFPRCRGKRL
jgi:23S rRNA (cytosine1962-C5)-methyltransferase